MTRQTQRASALKQANAVRTAKADLKRAIKRREKSVLDVLRDPPAYVEREPIGVVLTWAPYVGKGKVDELLANLVHPYIPVGVVSKFTRGEIIHRLELRNERVNQTV